MKNKYDLAAVEIVKNVGGIENVISLTHCVSRLRFYLKDESLANKSELEKVEGVISIIKSGGQYQVVVGNTVGEFYQAIVQANPRLNEKRNEVKEEKQNSEESDEKKGNIFSRIMVVFPSIFTPILPALSGAGMVKALLLIFTTFNLMSADSSTYKILAAAGNSTFYFLPILLAISSAKTFKVNTFSAVIVVGALLEPNFTGLFESNGEVLQFFNIPVVMMSYASTVIPAILCVWLFSYLEKFLNKYIPNSIKIFTVPMLSLLIMVPLTAVVIGPIGVTIAENLGRAIEFLNQTSGLVMGAIIGGTWTFLVMFGVHWGIVPIMINNISTLGYDTIRPPVASANFAQAGVALAFIIKAKSKKTKSYATSALLSIALAGVTEPAVYGLSVKYKKVLLSSVIGGALSGAFMGAMGVQVNTYILASVLTMPAFFGPTFVYYVIGLLISVLVTCVLTMIFGFDEDVKEAEERNLSAEMSIQ